MRWCGCGSGPRRCVVTGVGCSVAKGGRLFNRPSDGGWENGVVNRSPVSDQVGCKEGEIRGGKGWEGKVCTLGGNWKLDGLNGERPSMGKIE